MIQMEAKVNSEKIYGMSFSKVYPMLIAKAERKGRTREEVYEITEWLTGYSRRRQCRCSSS